MGWWHNVLHVCWCHHGFCFFIVFCWTSHTVGPSFLRWALRVAPSSGNLQTTEVHLVLPPMEGLANVPAVQLFWKCTGEDAETSHKRIRSLQVEEPALGADFGHMFLFATNLRWMMQFDSDASVLQIGKVNHKLFSYVWCMMFGFSAYDLMVWLRGFGFYK